MMGNFLKNEKSYNVKGTVVKNEEDNEYDFMSIN
jgi:hypothetical protein